QQRQLSLQDRRPSLGQGLDQIFQHSAHPPLHLDAVAAVLANLGGTQKDEVLPVRRPINKSYAPSRIFLLTFSQIAAANVAQQVMNLIDRQDSGGWIIYCWR